MLNEKDLLITIWSKPKQTLQFVLANCPKKYVTVLLALAGITHTLSQSKIPFSDHINFSIILLIAGVILGGLFGFLFYYIFAALLSWTGAWLNGKAKTSQFSTIIAWSLIPSICLLVLLVPKFIVLGDNTVDINPNELNQLPLILYYGLSSLEVVLSIYTFIILVQGIMLIQGFTVWKAILNSLLPGLVILVPLLMIIGIEYILK